MRERQEDAVQENSETGKIVKQNTCKSVSDTEYMLLLLCYIIYSAIFKLFFTCSKSTFTKLLTKL